MRLGYTNVYRIPHGYFGWLDIEEPDSSELQETKAPGTGEWFPSCRLMLLNYEDDKNYLGITHDSKTFSLEDIESEYLFIEFYNELCSECLEEVKTFKALYRLLEENPEWKTKVRILGIGSGSKKRNVARFRKEHEIPFPLVADEDWELFKCLGSPLLPASYLLKQEGSRLKIVMVQSGHVGSGEILMQKILSAVGQE